MLQTTYHSSRIENTEYINETSATSVPKSDKCGILKSFSAFDTKLVSPIMGFDTKYHRSIINNQWFVYNYYE